MPILADKNECTGCMACYNTCPRQAIDIFADKEGFIEPVVNTSKCIECKLCEQSCPIVTPIATQNVLNPKAYAAWHKEDRKKSSSGGAFSAFARMTIKVGGAGAAFDY